MQFAELFFRPPLSSLCTDVQKHNGVSLINFYSLDLTGILRNIPRRISLASMLHVLLLAAAAAASGTLRTPVGGDRVTIAPGVEMPLINMGGVMDSYSNGTFSSNHTLWLELGGRGIDTALMYSDATQREVGAAVRWGMSRGIPRKEIFVATKVPCCPMVHNDTFTSWCRQNPDKWNVTANVEHDFEMLGLEYVDLMLVHWACHTMEDTVATYKALQPYVKSGKVKAIGVSNFNATFLQTFLEQDDVKPYPPAINQCGYSIHGHGGNDPSTVTPLGRDTATRNMCRKHNVTYSAYSPLGGLSGISLWNNTHVAAVAKVHNVSAAQVALRWVVQQEVAAVTASSVADYDRSDLDIFGFELTEAEMVKLSLI